MRIDRLTLENFRCFERREFEFRPGFNLLIGDNASGKTAVLEGLACALGAVTVGLVNMSVSERAFTKRDPRNITVATSEGTRESRPIFPMRVICEAVRHEAPVAWTLLHDGAGQWMQPSITFEAALAVDEATTLPLFRYFGEHRRWQGGEGRALDRPSRTDAYLDALTTTVYERLDGWIRWQEAVAAQRGSALPQFAAVQRSVRACISEIERFYYDFTNEELRFELEGGIEYPVALLSAGYRNTIAMVIDIAYRCAVLNPQLGSEAPAKTPGVVLIDEIDLHLHPNWQRRIIGDLRAAFPEIQFIATTHSPFVIQSLEQGHLINLGEPRVETWRRSSIEDIAEGQMGVDNVQRSERFLAMVDAAERYYGLLEQLRDADDPRAVALKAELDALMIPYADDPAYAAWLKLERTAAEAAREHR